MKKVLVFGAFDILHPGHLNFLEQAKKYGDYLVVVIGRDKNIEKIKKRKPINHESTRLAAVQSIATVDHAVLGYLHNKHKIIKEIEPDIICLGYDQHTYTNDLDKILLDYNLNVNVIRLEPHHPEKYKSSKLR